MAQVEDADSIEGTIQALTALGCPDVRRAQGNPEFMARLGPQRLTPDIIAGPFRGNEHPKDFYIDVCAPQGEYFLKTQAGNPTAVAWMAKALQEGGPRRLDDIGVAHVRSTFLDPLNRKMERYGKGRRSVLFGYVSYFDRRQSELGWVQILDYVRCANTFLDYEQSIGPDGAEKVVRALAEVEIAATAALAVDLVHPIACIAAVVRQPAGHHSVVLFPNRLLLVRRDVGNHLVMAWLRRLVRRCQGASHVRMFPKRKRARGRR